MLAKRRGLVYTPAQQRFANGLCIQFSGTEKGDEARNPAGQSLRKILVFAEGFIFQPQAQDDEGVGRPVEFTVETPNEPVAPQNRQGVIAELALVLRFVYLPHIVEAKQHFGAPPGADGIERCKEDDLLGRCSFHRCPGFWHTPCAQIAEQLGVAAKCIVDPLPAFNLHLDDLAIRQHRLAYLLGSVKWHAAVKRILDALHPRQASETNFLFDQEAIRFLFVAFANQVRWCDRFGECVHALEVLAVVRHNFTDAPQVIQSQGAVLAAAVTLRSGARGHFEVAVAHCAALAQNSAHFDDGSGMLAGQTANPRVVLALTAHDHAPEWQLVHWADSQPAAPVKKLALLVGRTLPQARPVVEHPAVELDVVAASDDLQRVELQVLHGAHGFFRTLDAAPAPPRPQALLAENEATRYFDVDSEHDGLLSYFNS